MHCSLECRSIPNKDQLGSHVKQELMDSRLIIIVLP